MDEAFLRKVYALLVKTDMGAGPAGEIRDRIGKQFRARRVEMEEILTVIKDTVREIMDQPEAPLTFAESGPTIVMVVGVNGSGKTTSNRKTHAPFQRAGQIRRAGRCRYIPRPQRCSSLRSGQSVWALTL